MKIYSVKRLVLALIFTVGSFLTLPAYAWPEVDHMNMCGTATKAVRDYAGNWQGWGQYDRYIAQRGKAYYFRSNCPTTKAPVKKVKYKKPIVKKKAYKKTKVKSVKRLPRSKYNEKLDCARVDRLNTLGLTVQFKAGR